MNEQQETGKGNSKKTILTFILGLFIGIISTGFISYKIFVPTVPTEEEISSAENEEVSEEIAALDELVKAEEPVSSHNTEDTINEAEFKTEEEKHEETALNETSSIAETPSETVEEAQNNETAPEEILEEPLDIIVELKKGENLTAMLSRAGVEKQQLYKLTSVFSKKTNLKRLRPAQKFTLKFDNKGLSFLSMEEKDGTIVNAKREENESFSVTKSKLKLEKTSAVFEGEIKSNFSKAAAEAGMNPTQTKMFIDLYKDNISFSKDVRKNAKFAAVFEYMTSPSGNIIRDMQLVFASLESKGSENNRYYFKAKDGFSEYFNEKGHSISRFLNIKPVNAKRISSKFGPRLHPVLGKIGFHYGVDYPAKSGTKVYAAGDGIVTYVGNRGTYGKYVQIKHNRTYSTAYAHLSGFAEIKKGQKVKKGMLIGYVGSTGISTGPHLHFEVHNRGIKVDPLKQYAIVEKNLKGLELKKFLAFTKEVNPRFAKNDNLKNASLNTNNNDLN